MLVCPNDGIAFPMPDLLSLFNRLFAFGDMAFARQNAAVSTLKCNAHSGP